MALILDFSIFLENLASFLVIHEFFHFFIYDFVRKPDRRINAFTFTLIFVSGKISSFHFFLISFHILGFSRLIYSLKRKISVFCFLASFTASITSSFISFSIWFSSFSMD